MATEGCFKKKKDKPKIAYMKRKKGGLLAT